MLIEAAHLPMMTTFMLLTAKALLIIACMVPIIIDCLPIVILLLPTLATLVPIMADVVPIMADVVPIMAASAPIIADRLPRLASCSPSIAARLPILVALLPIVAEVLRIAIALERSETRRALTADPILVRFDRDHERADRPVMQLTTPPWPSPTSLFHFNAVQANDVVKCWLVCQPCRVEPALFAISDQSTSKEDPVCLRTTRK
jgi:hypothetical protein